MAVSLLGGLGGGGDIGLIIVLETLLMDVEPVYVSFAGCKPQKYAGRRVAGSLFEPIAYHPRDFEWSLKKLMPEARVYRVCVKSDRGEVEEALEWLDDHYSPHCTLHADIGGDGILTGFEEGLGSYITDTLARASLLWATKKFGWKSYLAIGGLQLEGGKRRVLDLDELVADLLYYEEKGGLKAVIDPPATAVNRAMALLHPGREMVSVMLPLYLAALEGRTAIRIAKGYSTGVHTIDWWTRYVFILDNEVTCRASPLCMSAYEGWTPRIRNWSPLEPPRDFKKILRRVKTDQGKHLRRLIRTYNDNGALQRLCTGA